jgi:hypothetical protein
VNAVLTGSREIQKRASGGHDPRVSLSVIFLTALILRIALVLLLKTYIIAPGDGLEMRNIAKSLAEGNGYSSPFGVSTGATAWAVPVAGGPEDKWTARVRLAKRLIHWIVLPFMFAGAYFAIRSRNYLSYPYLVMAFVYPLPYYFFSVAEHMHFPIESFMVILACYGAIRAAGLLEKREDVPQPRGMAA